VDTPDQLCSLYTTARKTNRWPVRPFYEIIESAALNVFVILTEKCQNLVNIRKRSDKILEGIGPCFNHSTCTS